ncbi:ADP-ribosylation factor-like protein 6 [Episyrphus balteatus]|uniref:ADP-ribosylation factor-like protein 6 n=1 Tax=Episyrphus balteatus TaxID=286459 RepID=UPI0024864A5D|nr:ADP-ribosylation factor-like protein 6 [Episyrphus balteatus]
MIKHSNEKKRNMGIFNKLAEILKLKKEQMTILVVGLNNSGKSTIINNFRTPVERTSVTVPTVGFAVEQFQNQGIGFTAIDMSGASRYRNLWEYHFKTCQGIVYVIDSSDRMRLVVVKDELELLLQHPDLENRRVPILFYGNKMDCADALSSVKIAAALGLENIEDKPWHISSSNALTGEGLEEGVQWLVEQIRMTVSESKDHKKRKTSIK